MTSLKFGTSGLRGLVTDLDTAEASAWTRAFCDHLAASGQLGSRTVMIGRDLRASSPSIARRAAAAVAARGLRIVDCGALPTPALALAALSRQASAVMVTGSHIPDNRNGLKFYAPKGEIDKADETGIRAAYEALDAAERGGEPDLVEEGVEAAGEAAIAAYVRRAVEAFGDTALSGLRVGLYEHSSVARDVLAEILLALGADIVRLGRSDRFVPVDTEAHRPEDVALIAGWASSEGFDALVSTDGDADRPLVADETGAILRGDILGLLTARNLGLETIVTPVTSSSAIEATGIVRRVLRTRVGSPFVIAGIETARAEGSTGIVGFEANGGVLLGDACEGPKGVLPALATRDAVLPILCALLEIKRLGMPLSAVVAGLKAGHAVADRLKDVPSERSGPFLARLATDDAYRAACLAPIGTIARHDALDGVRMVLDNGVSVHYRASGNAPELRCYVEAGTPEDARATLATGLSIAAREVAGAR